MLLHKKWVSPFQAISLRPIPLVSVRRIWSNMYLAILSGVLLALAYPVFNLEFLAFVAFVPLFLAIKNKDLKQAFLLSYFSGIVFWLLTIYWLIHVTLLGWILLVLYLALYFGLFGIFFKLYTYKLIHLTLSFILLPIAWVFLEWLRSMLLTGFPWALLGYSQYLNLPFIQIADIVGVWGVSFLVMAVNVAIYTVIAKRPKRFLARHCEAIDIEDVNGRSNLCDGLGTGSAIPLRLLRTSSSQPSGLLRPFGARNDVLLLLILLGLSLGYGYYRLHLSSIQYPVSSIKISLIQGNIPQKQKWDEAFRESILERYEALTRQAAKDRPDLIIWPETAVPGVVGEEPGLLARILKLAKDIKVPLLVGAVTAASTPATRYYNSAVLISSDGKILQQYDKLHLVPFGEYVPLERYFPFLRGLIGTPIGDFTAGKEYALFSAPVKFAVLICFEDIIPELSHKFVKKGAQFLVNITNDAWFKETSAPYQHAAASVFRAVENRAPVVRAANTGLSCFIDSSGRIYDRVSAGKEDIFVVGYKTREIEVRK